MNITGLVTTAEKIVSQSFGVEIGLHLDKTLEGRSGNAVLRLRSDRHSDSIPATFVLKAATESSPDSKEMLWNDWSALELLNCLNLDPLLCARLFGGDRSIPLIVMEDLGTSSVAPPETLQGSDPDLAAESLVSYIQCMGRLHASTRQKNKQFGVIRESFGFTPLMKPLYHDPWSEPRQRDPAEIHGAIEEYKAVFTALSLLPERSVDDEIEAVTAAVEESAGAFSCLCQGDQNGPGGCIDRGSGLHLIDFGASGFRHAFLEGMPHRLTWGCTKRIPERLYSRLDKAYQCELAKSYTEIADATVFQSAMMLAAARWNIFHIIWRVPDALQQDRPRGATSLRQQVVAWLEAFVNMSEEFNRMPALGRSARFLLLRLKALWPAETHTIPCYPAFQNY